jgi:cytoskeleton protein RodZ
VAIIVVVTAAFFWFTYEPAERANEIEPDTLAPFTASEESAPTVTGKQLPAADTRDDVEDLAAAAIEEQPVTRIAPDTGISRTDPGSTAPQIEMDLTFSGDCWTEVSDASGRRLYYDLGRVGRVVTLSGDAPLHVILGDSANVTISVDGRNYPIPASARSGRLARLDINSQ